MLEGELECDDGVGRFLGDDAVLCVFVWRGGGTALMLGSIFGAMLELDLREWWRPMMPR